MGKWQIPQDHSTQHRFLYFDVIHLIHTGKLIFCWISLTSMDMFKFHLPPSDCSTWGSLSPSVWEIRNFIKNHWNCNNDIYSTVWMSIEHSSCLCVHHVNVGIWRSVPRHTLRRNCSQYGARVSEKFSIHEIQAYCWYIYNVVSVPVVRSIQLISECSFNDKIY
jgi:hypothetical protein